MDSISVIRPRAGRRGPTVNVHPRTYRASLATLIFLASTTFIGGCNSSEPTASDATVTTEPGVEVSTKTPPAPPSTPTKSDQ